MLSDFPDFPELAFNKTYDVYRKNSIYSEILDVNLFSHKNLVPGGYPPPQMQLTISIEIDNDNQYQHTTATLQ